jgi:hypothetical protein
MKLKTGEQTIIRKSNFTYVLSSNPNWEVDLENSITDYKQKKRNDGWTFLSKGNEVPANEKRSITQRIHILEKKRDNCKITQTEKKELAKLQRQQNKWKLDYDTKENIRKLEEDKLLEDNPGKTLWEIYRDMGYTDKALRALKDAGYTEERIELLAILDGDYDDIEEVMDTRNIEDSFEDDSEDYSNWMDNLTEEEREAYYETENANYDQIPEEVRKIQLEEMERMERAQRINIASLF